MCPPALSPGLRLSHRAPAASARRLSWRTLQHLRCLRNYSRVVWWGGGERSLFQHRVGLARTVTDRRGEERDVLSPPGRLWFPRLQTHGAPVVKEISSNAEWVCNKFFKLVAATA